MAAKGGASEPRKHATAGQGRGHGRGQENPRIHYLPGRRSIADLRHRDRGVRSDLVFELNVELPPMIIWLALEMVCEPGDQFPCEL